MSEVTILHGDCVDVMKGLPENSVDAIVTDPPYGLRFMSKDWDDMGDGPSQEKWHEQWLAEAYRVLKPGGHIIAFGGSRTFHRLFSAAENMGIEIRDSILWIHGQGFPKSHNIEKALTKQGHLEATRYAGQGTALKPAHEPALLGRKPLSSKSIAQNVLEMGTGSLNIDGCRIGTEVVSTLSRGSNTAFPKQVSATSMEGYGRKTRQDLFDRSDRKGRFPSNVILGHTEGCIPLGMKKIKSQNPSYRTSGKGSNVEGLYGKLPSRPENVSIGYADKNGMEAVVAWECHPSCPVAILDTQSGTLKSGTMEGHQRGWGTHGIYGPSGLTPATCYADSGGASRFFYRAKASRRERELGCEHLKEKYQRKRGNHHTTIKPIGLMRQMVRLVLPNGGTVLDPFAGSGTTGVAAILEGFDVTLIEKESEYVEVIEARTQHALSHPQDYGTKRSASRKPRKVAESPDPSDFLHHFRTPDEE